MSMCSSSTERDAVDEVVGQENEDGKLDDRIKDLESWVHTHAFHHLHLRPCCIPEAQTRVVEGAEVKHAVRVHLHLLCHWYRRRHRLASRPTLANPGTHTYIEGPGVERGSGKRE